MEHPPPDAYVLLGRLMDVLGLATTHFSSPYLAKCASPHDLVFVQ